MATSWADRPFVAIDTESTGVDPFSARIVEVAAVTFDAGRVISSWSAIVDAGVEVPDEAAAIHGVTTERSKAEGQAPAVVLDELAGILSMAVASSLAVVGHNLRYDWPLILTEAARHGVEFPVGAPLLDLLVLDRWLSKRTGSRRLVRTLGHYDVRVEDDEATAAHGALPDAEATGHTLRMLVEHYPFLRDKSLIELHLIQVRQFEQWRQGLVDERRIAGEPDFDIPPGWPVPAYPERQSARSEKRTQPRPRALNARDVAMAAALAFPHESSSQQKRLRYALTHAATGGRATSANDLTPAQLHRVHEHLVDLSADRMRYEAAGDEGVTFWWPDGAGTTVLWSALEAVPAEVAS